MELSLLCSLAIQILPISLINFSQYEIECSDWSNPIWRYRFRRETCKSTFKFGYFSFNVDFKSSKKLFTFIFQILYCNNLYCYYYPKKITWIIFIPFVSWKNFVEYPRKKRLHDCFKKTFKNRHKYIKKLISFRITFCSLFRKKQKSNETK